MTFVIGLTGSIGMGKSTTAKMFSDLGIPVWDADAAVLRLYDRGGKAALLIAQLYPEAMEDDAVSRTKLRDIISQDPKVLDHLQELVHPLVAADREKFLSTTKEGIVLLDIPLLFETGGDARCDGIVVVTAPAEVQEARVIARGEMSKEDFQLILSRQMPDADKRKKARWVIETLTLDGARESVKEILREINEELADA